MSNVLRSYYVGDPEPPLKRGQDKFGQVQCLCWVVVGLPVSRGKDEVFSLREGGGEVSEATSFTRAQAYLHEYVRVSLSAQLAKAKSLVFRLEQALEKLGTAPSRLEQFAGPYEEIRR